MNHKFRMKFNPKSKVISTMITGVLIILSLLLTAGYAVVK
jgi:hypothetical protein